MQVSAAEPWSAAPGAGITAAVQVPDRATGMTASERRPGLGRVALVLAGLAAVVAVGRAVGPEAVRLATGAHRFGGWAPAIFVAGYVVACIAFVPGAIPTMAAGILFGLAAGTVYAFLGETLGGAAAFTVSRRLARPLVARWLAGTPRFAALDRAVAAQGRRLVFLLRLSPIFPFNFLNYALGLTSVRFADYLLASVAMLPGAFLYVYYGMMIGDVALLASGAHVRRDALAWVLLAAGLAATAVVTTVLARLATRAVREATAEAATELPPRHHTE
jgi:uncharacterized membrane protein YdjX (TVP38/TMEM64 family)